MTPELEKFIELATRPLEGREAAREEARGELMSRLGHRGVPLERIAVAEPTERLEKAKPLPDAWRRGLLLGGLLGLLGLLLFGVWQDGMGLFRVSYAQRLTWGSWVGGPPERMDRPAQLFFSWLDELPQQPVFTGRPGQFEALCRERPEDLALLEEAFYRRPFGSGDFMTPDQRELIERLDPDNALWPLMEMEWELAKARPSYGRASTASDPDALDRAWERWAEAAGKKVFRSHADGLARRQLAPFVDRDSVMDGLVSSQFLELVHCRSDYEWRYWRDSQTLIEERLDALEAEEDAEGLEKLCAQIVAVGRLMSADEYPDSSGVKRFDAFVGDSVALWPELESALTRTGQTALRDEMEDRFQALKRVNPPSFSSRGEVGLRHQLSDFDASMARPGEAKPGSKADMAMLNRFMAWPLILVASVFVLLWAFEACRRSLEVKGMARGLMPLLSRRDHLVIGGVGLLLPWIYWWGITRLTLLGCGASSFDDEWEALVWLLQLVLAVLLGMVALTQAVIHCWAKRGDFLGLAGAVPKLGWVVVALVALAIPAAGIVLLHPFADEDAKAYFLLGCAGMGACGVLWLLWIGIMNLCTLRHGALRPNLIARTLLPWSLAGLASLLLAAGVLRFAEGWWYRRDPLLPPSTSQHYANALEERDILRRAEALRRAFAE